MPNIVYKNLDDFLGHRTGTLDESMPVETPLPVYEEFCKQPHAPIAVTITVPPKWIYKRRIWENRQIDNQYKILSEVILYALKDTAKDIESHIDYYIFFEVSRTGKLHAHGTLHLKDVVPHPYYCRKVQDKLVKYGYRRCGLDIRYTNNRSGWNAYIRKDYGKIKKLKPMNGSIYSIQEATPTYRAKRVAEDGSTADGE